ncbi:hypothetical protein AB4Z43_29270 [Mesorhizobium sp. 2RAF45]|uniref:hypothetical protein n=1 Tax=Mesorhizobium sp. 2RAF45 TaxID=3233001 RepID=UPI003F98B74B
MLAFVALCVALGYAIAFEWPMNRSPWAVAAVPIALCCNQFRSATRLIFIAIVGALALVAAGRGAKFNMKYSIFGPPVLGLLIALSLSLALLMAVQQAAKFKTFAAPMAKLGEASLVIMFLHQSFHFSLRDLGVSNEATIFMVAVSGPFAIYLILKRSSRLSPWFLGTGAGTPGRAIAWLKNGVGWRVAKYRDDTICFAKPYVAQFLIGLRWPLRGQGRPHGLPGDLIVSLTSYPKRFETLHLTLRCLLSQTVVPDRVVLWLTSEHAAQLPPLVTDLKAHGLEIRFCKDVRSYKKIVPALLAFPKAYIVTADDDVYYGHRWLEELVEKAGESTIVCHRGHSVAFDDAGQIAPYSNRSYDVSDTANMLFATGVGGVLYGPESLSPEAVDEDKFIELCPQGDDIWLFWMGQRVGSKYIKTQKRRVDSPGKDRRIPLCI